LGNILHGDLGYSITSKRPILYEIGSRIPNTLFLMLTSLSLAVTIAIPIGVITAVKQYSKTDYGLNALAILLASTPVFVLGLVAIYIFAVNLHWLPTSELHTAGRFRHTRRAPAPDSPGVGPGDRERRAPGALHPREHARRVEQRVRHDRALQGPRGIGS